MPGKKELNYILEGLMNDKIIIDGMRYRDENRSFHVFE
jgi:hypothetical protein